MLKKNQSKSDKKTFSLNNQKKPLPKPDPRLIQIAHKMHKGFEKSAVTKGKESAGTKGKESAGTKGKESAGTKRHK